MFRRSKTRVLISISCFVSTFQESIFILASSPLQRIVTSNTPYDNKACFQSTILHHHHPYKKKTKIFSYEDQEYQPSCPSFTILPEKKKLKKIRDEQRIRIRFERQAQRVLESRRFLNHHNDHQQVHHHQGQQQPQYKQHRSETMRNLRRQNLMDHYGNHGSHQSSFLRDIAKSLDMASATSTPEKSMEDIIQKYRLHTKLSMRDETDLIRLLGSRRAFTAMLYLLQHSSSSSNTIYNGNDNHRLPNVHSYTSAIAALAHSSFSKDRKKALDLFYNVMPEKGVQSNSFTFTAVFLAVEGPQQAVDMMNHIQQLYGNKTKKDNDHDDDDSTIFNVFTFNSAIHSCSRGKSANGFQTAYQFYQQMQNKHIPPDEKTLASLLHCAAKSISFTHSKTDKQWIMKSAIALFEELRSQIQQQQQHQQQPITSPKIWGAALSVCAAAGADIEAKRIFDFMDDIGCTKNILHYNQYLSALAKAGKHDMVSKVFQLMMSEDCHVLPEIVTLNTVLGAFAKTGNYKRAHDLLTRMKQGEFELNDKSDIDTTIQGKAYIPIRDTLIENKLYPDTISYNSVLSACNHSKEALKLVNEMRLSRRKRNNSIIPTAVTYTNAITACRKSNPPDLDTAKQLFEMATKSDSITPNVFMYSALIWTAERCKNADEALIILNNMKTQGCKPNVVSYDGVITALTNKVLEEGGKGDASSSAESIETITELYESMKNENILPTTMTYQKLALAINHHFANCNFTTNYNKEDDYPPMQSKISILKRIMTKMSKQERTLKLGGPILKSLILAYANLRRYDDAKRVFESFVGETDIHVTSAMLYACSRAIPSQWKAAVSLVKQYDAQLKLLSKRNNINPMLLNYAVIACSKQNKWEEALSLIDDHYIFSGAPRLQSQNSTNSSLSVGVLNALMASCGRCGRPDVAVTILNEMPYKYGVKPDGRSYRSVIIACNQAEHERQRNNRIDRYSLKYVIDENDDVNDDDTDDEIFEFQWWECALSLLRRMQEEMLRPDVQTYSSVISCCQAAGQWQRAIGVLQYLMKEIEEDKKSSQSDSSLNLFCFNAAIAACEKGGAWIEALSLFEKLKANNDVRPNFVTINSLLIALDGASQKELADHIYKEALRDGIISPWKFRSASNKKNNNRSDLKIRVLDLHQFSVPMAKVAVANVMESLLKANPVHDLKKDLIIIVGKGKGSDSIQGPVLLPVVVNLLKLEYGVESFLDENNSGRIRIPSDSLLDFTSQRAWRSWEEWEEESV